eukprot:15269745-Alexandrium_andersonii.AAC.1
MDDQSVFRVDLGNVLQFRREVVDWARHWRPGPAARVGHAACAARGAVPRLESAVPFGVRLAACRGPCRPACGGP